MEGITFKGRGFHDPSLTIDTDEHGLRIRTDCALNPEAWAELSVSPPMLAELLSRVCVHLGADGALLVPLLDKLTAPLSK